jgi:nitroimidazol reductase NimA-like FMN-containing flavoprotein (pyridoxamine 5'-phosphate oxidase superfamily)
MTPQADPPAGHFSEVAADECWNLLDTTTVGRLAFAGDDGIVVIPVNFIVLDEAVYFRTSPHTVVAPLADGRDDVAFEVDHHEDMLQRGWSVLLHGSTVEVEDAEAEQARRSSSRLGPWAPGDRSLMIKLTPKRISGRRVSLH